MFGFGFPTTVQVNCPFLFSWHKTFLKGVINSGGTGAKIQNDFEEQIPLYL